MHVMAQFCACDQITYRIHTINSHGFNQKNNLSTLRCGLLPKINIIPTSSWSVCSLDITYSYDVEMFPNDLEFMK